MLRIFPKISTPVTSTPCFFPENCTRIKQLVLCFLPCFLFQTITCMYSQGPGAQPPSWHSRTSSVHPSRVLPSRQFLGYKLSTDFQSTPTLCPSPVLLREPLQSLRSRAHTTWSHTPWPLLGITSPPGPSRLRHRTSLPVCCHQMILPALRSGGNTLRGPLQTLPLAPRAGLGGPCCDFAHPLLLLPPTTRFLRSNMTHLLASVRTSAP